MAGKKLLGRIRPVIVALALLCITLSAAGCTQVERTPTLSTTEIVGFWMGPSNELTAELLQAPPAPAQPLDDLVAGFNLARRNAWVFQPSEGIALNVVFVLRGGGQVLASMSPEFPAEHAVIGLRGEEVGSPDGVTWYWVKAPAFVRTAGAMARDTLELNAMTALDPSGDWFYSTKGMGE